MLFELNIWSFFFSLAILQALFLFSILPFYRHKNPLATALLGGILLFLLISCFDYILLSSGLYKTYPRPFGVSFGLMLLFGPFFMGYARAVLQAGFSLRLKDGLHLIPYVFNLLLNWPILAMGRTDKLQFLEYFLSGQLPLRSFDLVIFSFQSLHLSAYLLISARFIKKATSAAGRLHIPLLQRARWLKALHIAFCLFTGLIGLLLVFTALHGFYLVQVNYLFVLFLVAMILFIAYAFIWQREVLLPHFEGARRPVAVPDEDKGNYLERIRQLLEEEKIYLRTELSLVELAEAAEMSPHQLSRLINEEFGRSFFELINFYRVEEVKQRLCDPRYNALSILGIAMESGFSSKSSFNAEFKKCTGLTPSAYKKQVQV